VVIIYHQFSPHNLFPLNRRRQCGRDDNCSFHYRVLERQYPDPFWALLGGGGGTYAILTSVTYRIYPSLPAAAAVIIIKTVNTNTTQALFTEFLRMTPQLSDADWAGYGRVTNNHISFPGMAPNVYMNRVIISPAS